MVLNINPVSGRPYSDRYYELKTISDTMPMNQPENIDNLNRLLDTNQVIVLSSATGSGKTTTINQHMLNYLRLIHGSKVKTIITQPRRAPATEIPDWVAQLMDVTLGEEVGYKIKNEIMANENSAVTFVTEGILRRMFMNDPLVSDFNAVILDECHELTTDLIMTLLFLKRLVISNQRPDLKIVLMSATANIKMFMNYFDRCGRLDVPGRMFSVERNYAKETSAPQRLVKDGVKKIAQILNDPKSVTGDILFFLSGKRDLMMGCQELEFMRKAKKISRTFKCLEFSSDTPKARQTEIMEKPPSHWNVDVKVVMATNVAEASLTIKGIVYVIDSGRANVGGFDIATRQKTLDLRWVSKAQIGQRVGRAGRTAPGIAYLLYTEKQFEDLHDFKSAEILSEDLTGLSLQLLCTPGFHTIDLLLIGYSELIAVPSRRAIDASLQNLAFLGALDSNNTVSQMGRAFNNGFNLELPMARSLIFSRAFHCYYEIVRIAAMASVEVQAKNFFFENEKGETQVHKFREAGGELMTLLQIYVAFEEVAKEEREAFCKRYLLNLQLLEKAEKEVDKLRKRMRSADIPPLRQEDRVIVDIPFYQTKWLTARVNPADVRHNIVRALLMGHFMNVVIYQHNKLTTLKSNVFVKPKPEQKKSPLALYAAATRMNDNLNVSGLTEIQGASWLLEAASHYLATVENPEQREIIKEMRLLYDVTSIKYTPTAMAISTNPTNNGLSPVDPQNTS